MLVLLLIVVLIILSLMFGGFQKGTRSSGLGPLAPVCTGCTSATELSAYSLWMPRSCSSEEALEASGPHGATALRLVRTYAA